MLRSLLVVSLLFVIAACGDSRERVPYDAPGYIKGKAVHPTVKIGVPYRVMGKKYYPEYDPDYNEVGLASWYGPNFHGKSTANGERYNQWAMTAAHKTLPMPSIVRVSNLETGKQIKVRINDRGPFAEGRIIDLSRAAAEELGTVRAGVARVRVEYLKGESERYIAKLKLKKPDAWGGEDEFDVAQNEERSPSDVSFPPTTVISAIPAPPVSQPIKRAVTAPEIYHSPRFGKKETTLDVRGVQMEEIGYAEDAFTVLDEGDYKKTVSYIPPNKREEETFDPYQSVSFEGEEKPSEKSAPPKKSGGWKAMYVQAGSFSQESNAYGLAEKLTSISATEVESALIHDKTLYRVLLGPTMNQETAAELRIRLREYGINDAKIIRK